MLWKLKQIHVEGQKQGCMRKQDSATLAGDDSDSPKGFLITLSQSLIDLKLETQLWRLSRTFPIFFK